MEEQSRVHKLVQLLLEDNKMNETKVIDLLCSIIQNHSMYGGLMYDLVEYQIDKVRSGN